MTEGNDGLCKMDMHADTCVAGSNFLMCEFDGTTCEVSPFTDEYQSMTDVPIVLAATAWTDEESGGTIVLWFNQMLWYGNKLDHSLINPNQLCHNGSLCAMTLQTAIISLGSIYMGIYLSHLR
jgi:hypothetical protein